MVASGLTASQHHCLKLKAKDPGSVGLKALRGLSMVLACFSLHSASAAVSSDDT